MSAQSFHTASTLGRARSYPLERSLDILADVHEFPSGVPGRLAALGVEVESGLLSAGDYCVARGVLVERKSVLDLHDSLLKGRLWRQVGALRRASTRPFLLVEGHDLDRGPIHPHAIRGVCLSVQEQGVHIIRTTDVQDTALWLWRLAVRARITRPRPERPVLDQIPNWKRNPPEAVLAAVPGISVRLARLLLEEFGSVAGVIEAGPQRWAVIAGVGRARAEALAKALL